MVTGLSLEEDFAYRCHEPKWNLASVLMKMYWGYIGRMEKRKLPHYRGVHIGDSLGLEKGEASAPSTAALSLRGAVCLKIHSFKIVNFRETDCACIPMQDNSFLNQSLQRDLF